ncbi:hypothetical protein E2C01_045476 [Portunus trituberculatus]|uniref:Uncharacterized protein n=1 Tax=Portunus trituberculatus TaxID=210409 RepID=A0A5B7G1B4_PORTR|nr:hypothetical protein [Portunus trituberculatus]
MKPLVAQECKATKTQTCTAATTLTTNASAENLKQKNVSPAKHLIRETSKPKQNELHYQTQHIL